MKLVLIDGGTLVDPLGIDVHLLVQMIDAHLKIHAANTTSQGPNLTFIVQLNLDGLRV